MAGARKQAPRRASDGPRSFGSRSSGLSSPAGGVRKSWGEEEEDYGVQIHGKFSDAMDTPELDKEVDILRLERALEGEGTDSGTDSDSSLDLHTPLP